MIMETEYETKRTLVWTMWYLANSIEDKQEFEDRAMKALEETMNLVKNNVVLDPVSKPLDAEIQQELNKFSKTQGESYPTKERF
jgi:hypothetical protein